MDIQIMKKVRSSESGASLLKLMQSKSIRTMDLLVREALQNSLDASKNRKPKTVVKVDFKTGTYKTKEFTKELGDIGSRLNCRYTSEISNFIAIRDSGTFGLTGTNDPNDDKCNLQKLIYQISKAQDKKGSGGSWGLGKTTFFRLGIGVVLYYSRVSIGDKYESRLAVSLVENEECNPLVTEAGYRGIAYFGKYEKWPDAPFDYTVPLTNESDISRIIKIFNLTPYSGDETGTTILIPYVDFDALLSEMIPVDFPERERKPAWISDIGSCIKLLVQRWYAPRLSNSEYDGSWLKVTVNGELISHDMMEPFFEVLQELYKKAFNSNEKSDRLSDDLFHIEPISIKNVIGKKCGVLSLVTVDSKMINLTKEKYRNIYAMIGDYDAPVGTPIIAYVRKPAMVVRYETVNSSWVPSIQNLDENKIVIGLFVLDSYKDINVGNGQTKSLEEYIRDNERSDHYGWHDDSVNSFVQRISENVKKNISQLFNQRTSDDLEKRSKLSDIFTEFFLPANIDNSSGGSSATGSGNISSGPKSGKSKGSRSSNNIISNEIYNGDRIIVFRTKLGNKDDSVGFKFILSSENGSISPKEWEDSMNTPYPLHITSFSIIGFARPRGKIVPCNFDADMLKTSSFNSDFTINLDQTIMNIPYGAEVICKSGSTIECRVAISSDLPSISFDIRCTSGRRKE